MFQLDVAPGLSFVEGERRGRFPFGNVLVLQGRAQRVLVDTGAGDGILDAVMAGGPFDVVINTHYHLDHVRGNGRFLAGSGNADRAGGTGRPGAAPVYWCPAGEADAFTSEEGFLRFTGFNLPGLDIAKAFPRGLGWTPTPISRELADGEVLDFGGLEAAVLRLPGHTPGHTGLWFPAERVIFSADIDLSSFGPWYGDVYASVDDYLTSLRRLDSLVDEASGSGRRRITILTSHRRPLSYERFKERLPGFVARVDEREERILGLLTAEGPLTLDELAARWPIYGPLATRLPGIWKSEYFMVGHHLDRLATSGRVEGVQLGGKDLWRAL